MLRLCRTSVIAAHAVNVDELPKGSVPVVQMIDDWFTARRLALICEARVGKGKLLITSIDLDAPNPVSRQLRRSLLKYMGDGPE